MRQTEERGRSEASQVTAPPAQRAHKGRMSATGDTMCCGKPMEPQLARARDRSGQEFFIAVWCCGRCGKIIY